jgi:Flp pilus assembly pilin Flp
MLNYVNAKAKGFLNDESGQTATEYMLIISVIVIALVGGAYLLVPAFKEGMNTLKEQVKTGLTTGCIDGATKNCEAR